MKWPEIQKLHDAAADSLSRTAERVDREKWLVPRANGKWTPAQVVDHLSRVYDLVTNEIKGGAGMRLRLTFPQRLFFRLLFLGRILRGGYFPENAPAPYETEPGDSRADQSAVIAAFRARAKAFAAAATEAHDSGRRVRITHAYFGTAPVDKAMLLCARHIEHHEKQLPTS